MPSHDFKTYIVSLKLPPETVNYFDSSGAVSLYEIYQEVGTSLELIKCDLCGRFLPLTSKRKLSKFKVHRNSETCQNEVKKQQKSHAETASSSSALRQSFTFVNTFQDYRQPGPSYSPASMTARNTILAMSKVVRTVRMRPFVSHAEVDHKQMRDCIVLRAANELSRPHPQRRDKDP
ncbi:hypothetical protein BDN70DRAFT_979950 [Pholiota conissans]|uniref:Uncharacterized protein n=1 Tax=Pholiota conissans TaxID=109636 RepID=A0A9P6D1B4_9AGAR|nr:hypothetical protein BDN70DRAFT_979950 [Pholiota conissans]